MAKKESSPCPNAKRAKGRLRYKGEPEYTCVVSCSLCHGLAWTKPCPTCEGCGLVRGERCSDCHSSGRLPASSAAAVPA